MHITATALNASTKLSELLSSSLIFTTRLFLLVSGVYVASPDLKTFLVDYSFESLLIAFRNRVISLRSLFPRRSSSLTS